ncbi:Ca-activated chloride channel family protein, partial [Fusobacterium sp. PH5-29]
MKNKILLLILICLSLALIYLDKGKYQNFWNLSVGNIKYKSQKYQKARENYVKINDNFDLDKVKSNIVKTFYKEENYNKVLEEESKEFFIRGNSNVKLGDLALKNNNYNTDLGQVKEYYQKALNEYKNMMLESSDINIKKNYEIVQEKLEKLNKEEEKKEDKKDQNQENNQDNKSDKTDNNNQEQNNTQNQNNNNQDKQSK